MSKTRTVCFTINNYSPRELELLRNAFAKHDLRFLIFQQEVGTNGTPHIQGYAVSHSPMGQSGWHQRLGARAAILFAKGSAGQNIAYCSKEETRLPDSEPERFGEPPVQGKRKDLDAVVDAVKEGHTIEEIATNFGVEFIRCHKGITALRQAHRPQKRSWQTEVFWFYGPTGTGKSRLASELAPDSYWKMGASKWWDGYDGHEDVIIDDYRRDLCPFHELLRLFDRYPSRVEFKGGSCQFLAKRIFVTTPKDPRTTWEGRVEEDLEQLCRRIKEIRYFTLDNPTGELIWSSAQGTPYMVHG